MLKRCLLAGTVALMSAGIAVNAQSSATPQQNPNEPRATQTEREGMKKGTTTVTGCLYRERDIPGRSPNVAERAGVLEDYILANVQMSATSGQTARTAEPPTTEGATGTTGKKHSMFKLEHADDERLRALAGKRVEVTGRIDAEAGDTRPAPGTTGTQQQPPQDRSVGPDRIELPEFEVSSIREVSGDCPAKPEAPQR